MKIHYIKQILVRKTFKRKFITGYQKQNLKQDIRTIIKSFNHEKHKNCTQLSNELWKIKASKEEPVLVWNILGQYQSYNYNVNTKRSLLSLNEKLQIAIYRRKNKLNKRTGILANAGIETNVHWQVMIAWIETSDVKFLGIIEIFEAGGSLIY